MRMPARRRDAANACGLSKERNDAGAAFGFNPEGRASLGRIASLLVAYLRMTKRRSSRLALHPKETRRTPYIRGKSALYSWFFVDGRSVCLRPFIFWS